VLVLQHGNVCRSTFGQEAAQVSLAIQHLCNGLIRRSIELRALYRHAAMRVSEPGLRTVLEEEAQSLSLVIAELQEQIRSHEGTPATRRRMFGAVRHRFDALVPRSDDAWIRLLARHEQSLLRSFERVIARVGASDVDMKAELHRQLPRLHSIDLDMNSLAKAIGVGH
jgi:uncharacterized protein (TIGR02284 family)